MLEDGGEVDNVFRNNLGAFTKKVSTLISSEETDDEPSTFWITITLRCVHIKLWLATFAAGLFSPFYSTIFLTWHISLFLSL